MRKLSWYPRCRAVRRNDKERHGEPQLHMHTKTVLRIGKRKGVPMATQKASITKTAKTKRSIKRALLSLLSEKPLDEVGMSELARRAEVSRNTLYQHYGNVHDVFVEIARDFDNETAPVMSQLECYEGIEPEGTQPFCQLIRTSPEYQAAFEDPRFLDSFLEGTTILEDHSFYKSLVETGYSPTVAKALAIFQINGCFKAIKAYGADEATWHEVRETIDTFICGGLDACRQRKLHQLKKTR